MKNCTSHSIKRWVERVVGITDIKQRDEYIRENSEQIKQHMNKTFEYAEYVYKGQIGDNITRNYYVHNDIVFCLNTTDDAIITIYKINFGFTAEINLQISKGLIKEVRRLLEEQGKIDEEVIAEIDRKKEEEAQMAEQEELIKAQLKIVQERRKALSDEIKTIDSRSKILDFDIKRNVSQLVNSKDYRDDIKNL